MWSKLKTGLLLCSAFASNAPVHAKPAASATRPNIIFILVDDLPINALGVDNPRLRTPNLDRLAKSGTYIPRAAVTTSLCSPSRATILTGQTTRNHRIVDNSNASEKGLTFFPTYLQKAGYQTAFFGKWHMGEGNDSPRRGFDQWVSFAGQGSYLPMGDLGQNVRQTLNINGHRVDRKAYMTDELTDYQLEWLTSGRDKSKPFFLYMSHKAVHSPCIPAPRHARQYAGDTMMLPASYADTTENYRGKPVWVRNQRNSWHGTDIRNATGPQSLLNERRDCDAVLGAVDDSLGRTLDYLKRAKLEKDTVILFFSDNGSMWGAHGLIDKRNAYEESVRVPMIAWGPGRIPAGVKSEMRVRNLDLAPTILDLAGVTAPAQFEGQSVKPLIEGKAAWKDWPQQDFVYEYYWDWEFPMTPATFSIVRNNLKYIQYFGVWDLEELYDLSRDPGEMTNLIFDPAHAATRADLRHRLYTQLSASDGRHSLPFTERTYRGMVFRNAKGTPVGSFPEEWELQPTPGKDFDYGALVRKMQEK